MTRAAGSGNESVAISPPNGAAMPRKNAKRTVRHFAVVKIAHEPPREPEIKQVAGASRVHERRKQPIHSGQLFEPARAQEEISRLVEFRLIEVARPVPTALAGQFAQIEMMQRRKVRQFAIPRRGSGRLGENGNDTKPQIGLPRDQTVHPGRNAAGHVGIGSLNDQTDVRNLPGATHFQDHALFCGITSLCAGSLASAEVPDVDHNLIFSCASRRAATAAACARIKPFLLRRASRSAARNCA